MAASSLHAKPFNPLLFITMKKTYIKPLASAITFQTEGSMLLGSPKTINVDAGKETNERWSQKKDGPWNNNNSEGIWGGMND